MPFFTCFYFLLAFFFFFHYICQLDSLASVPAVVLCQKMLSRDLTHNHKDYRQILCTKLQRALIAKALTWWSWLHSALVWPCWDKRLHVSAPLLAKAPTPPDPPAQGKPICSLLLCATHPSLQALLPCSFKGKISRVGSCRLLSSHKRAIWERRKIKPQRAKQELRWYDCLLCVT